MTADAADFGGRLRQAREARGMSLAYIATATKISTMALEALERNDVSRLPGGLFSRAFVRAYAREVGLDPERTVEQFVARFGGGDLDGPDSPRHAITDLSRGSGLRWFGLVLTVALVALFFGVQRYLNRDQPTTARPAAAAATHAAQANPASPRTEPVPPTTSPAVAPATSAAEQVNPAAGQPPTGEPAPGQAATSGAAATSLPAGGRAAQPPIASTGTAQSAGAPPAPVDRAPVDAQAATLRLVLTTNASCWVSVRVDGNRVAARRVPQGERLEVSAAEAIVLTVGDPAAVTYTINGTPGRALGKPGEMVTAVITAANYPTYIQR